MSDLEICRICLSSSGKLYKFDSFSLKFYYEEIMCKRITKQDTLPKYFCYECASNLHKTHKFKSKCNNGEKILHYLSTKCQLTYLNIRKIDRESNNLTSQIQISIKTDRVKTYTINRDDDDTPPIVAVDIITNDDSNDLDHYEPIASPIADPVVESGDDDDDKAISIIAQELRQNDNHVNDKVDIEPVKEETKVLKKKLRNGKKQKVIEKKYKFNLSDTKSGLDSKYWHKITLTEDEAVKGFSEKASDAKYLKAAFKCETCYRGFSKEEMLDRHNELRHKECLGERVCRFCAMRFRCQYQLQRHMKQHYLRYKCLRCDVICPLESTAHLHEEFHSGPKKICAHCGREFKKTTTYYTHLRTHRSDHICTMCGASFVSELGLRQHKKIKHVATEMDITKTDGDEKTYCDKCDMRFQTREAFEEHLFHSDRHTDGVEYELDEYSVPRKVLGLKMKETIAKDLRERKDGGPLPVRKKRRVIVRKINHKKPTTCYQCGKHFATQTACMKHHLEAHPRTSFFAPNERSICEICGISLAPSSVTSHQNLHTKEKEYPCDTCGKIFYATIGLKQHQLTHSDTKPAACSLCDKRFKQISSLNLHYKTYHLKQPYPKRNLEKKRRSTDLYDSEDRYPFEEFLSASRRPV